MYDWAGSHMQSLSFAHAGSDCLRRKCLRARRCLMSACEKLIAHMENTGTTVSFVIIINKKIPVAERGTVTCILGYKNNSQSISLLLHLGYYAH